MVGVPVERLGEEIYAFIELKDRHKCTEEAIRVYCKEKVISDTLTITISYDLECKMGQYYLKVHIFKSEKRLVKFSNEIKCELDGRIISSHIIDYH